jgi:hypothetical protein
VISRLWRPSLSSFDEKDVSSAFLPLQWLAKMAPVLPSVWGIATIRDRVIHGRNRTQC